MKRLLIVLLAVHLLGTQQAHAEATNSAELRIGIMLCLTGNCADWGTAAMRGAQLAAEELNTQGGVLETKIVLTVEDTAESVSGAKTVTAFRKLQSSGSAQFIVGPSWAPGAKALLPLVHDSTDVLIITPSATSPEFTRSSDHLFNIRAAEELATKVLARYAIERGWERAAIFGSQQAAILVHGNVFEREFRKLGGTITARLEPPPTLSSIKTVATKIVASKPDVVFLISYLHMAAAAKELSKLGFQGPKMTISIDEARIRAAGGALEGVIVSSFPGGTPDFVRKFQQRFGEAPGLSAEGGYDALQVFARSIQKADSTEISAVKKAIYEIQFEGASGKIAFNQDGELVQEPVLLIAQSETLQPIKTGE